LREKDLNVAFSMAQGASANEPKKTKNLLTPTIPKLASHSFSFTGQG